jgi:hypothetical protein
MTEALLLLLLLLCAAQLQHVHIGSDQLLTKGSELYYTFDQQSICTVPFGADDDIIETL